MTPRLKDLLNLVLIMLASVLLVLGILMAYEDWNVMLGILIVLVGWVLVSLVQMFVKSEART